jgi:hypothetical protein
MSTSGQKHPKMSENVQKRSKTFENVRKCPKTSQNVRKRLKRLQRPKFFRREMGGVPLPRRGCRRCCGRRRGRGGGYCRQLSVKLLRKAVSCQLCSLSMARGTLDHLAVSILL